MKKFAILSLLFLVGCSSNIYPWEKGTSLEQALERAGTKALNKGWELMEATISSIQTYNKIFSK